MNTQQGAAPALTAASIDKLIREHDGKLRALASSRLRAGVQIDDLVQEGRIALYRAAQKFDPTRGVDFWAYARKAAIRAMHRTAKKARVAPSRPVGVEDDGIDLIAAPEKRDDGMLVVALMALDEKERALLVLRFDKDKSLRDIANDLGISLGLAHQRVQRAIETLRAKAA